MATPLAGLTPASLNFARYAGVFLSNPRRQDTWYTMSFRR
jgi:hypothetical protein